MYCLVFFWIHSLVSKIHICFPFSVTSLHRSSMCSTHRYVWTSLRDSIPIQTICTTLAEDISNPGNIFITIVGINVETRDIISDYLSRSTLTRGERWKSVHGFNDHICNLLLNHIWFLAWLTAVPWLPGKNTPVPPDPHHLHGGLWSLLVVVDPCFVSCCLSFSFQICWNRFCLHRGGDGSREEGPTGRLLMLFIVLKHILVICLLTT